MSHYLHGSSPSEQNRLSRLNDLINDRCLPKMNILPGFSILDVGSGLGQMSYRMVQKVGENGRVVGIERDEKQLSVAMKNFSLPNLEFRKGDAYSIPFKEDEPGKFDFVHARFLLEHLSKPQVAVGEMMRGVRLGGEIFLADDDHEAMILFPEPEGFKTLWSAYMDSYLEVGNNPFIGRKLPKLLADAGCHRIKNDTAFFGDCFGTATFQLFVSNLVGVISTSHDVMIEAGLISEEAYQNSIKNIEQWSIIPYASIWYPVCIASGIKP